MVEKTYLKIELLEINKHLQQNLIRNHEQQINLNLSAQDLKQLNSIKQSLSTKPDAQREKLQHSKNAKKSVKKDQLSR